MQNTKHTNKTYQNCFDEVLELGVPPFGLEPRGRVSGDEEEGSHRVHVAERRLGLGHLQGGDAQAPEVRPVVVGGVGVFVAGNDLKGNAVIKIKLNEHESTVEAI